jgi:predicted secreted protein
MAAAFFAAACDGSPTLGGAAPVVVDETTAETVEAALGQEIHVRLRAQMGAGFSWALSGISGSGVELIGSFVESKPSDAAPVENAVDIQVFRLRASGPGDSVAHFVYRRPWLTETPAKRFDVRVRVHGP